MLNCLVNSIFHILFCIALAKVLKSSAVSPESSVCDLCLPFFIPFFFIHHLIHHEKIFLAGNSDSAMICEAFQFIAFSLCWVLDTGLLFSHSYRHIIQAFMQEMLYSTSVYPNFVQPICLNLCVHQWKSQYFPLNSILLTSLLFWKGL